MEFILNKTSGINQKNHMINFVVKKLYLTNSNFIEKNEEFFFGTGIDLKIYGIFQKTLKEILGENCKKLDFIYAKY